MIFETPILARSIIAGVMLIAGMFCVAWYLPKLAPQYAGGENKSKTNLVHGKPSRLEHNGVLWEDIGKSMFGIKVYGPLCPKDLTPLGSEHSDKIKSSINYDNLVSDSQYHSRLFCPECKSKYTLGAEPKTTEDSLNEVRSRFEGKRNREQETK